MPTYVHWRRNGSDQGGGAPPTFDFILSMQDSIGLILKYHGQGDHGGRCPGAPHSPPMYTVAK